VRRREKREKREKHTRGEAIRCLYREFASYYTNERCRWAPANPRRVFNLAFKTLFRHFGKTLSLWDFVGEMYATLGVRQGEPRGLFQDFDPAAYNGKLSLESHFLGVFKKRLWARLRRIRHPRSDRGRRGNVHRFQANPQLGLISQRGGIGPRRHGRFDSEELEATSVDQPRRSWDVRALAGTVGEAMTRLNPAERNVILLTYWVNPAASAREIGLLLGVDHKTVQRRHDKAIAKLRDFYREELAA
jgi:RNA polymerase sigma factor (sigma-70 family)